MFGKIIICLMAFAIFGQMEIAVAQIDSGNRGIVNQADLTASPLLQHATLGIEGNGQPLLGIEGNGIIQRFDPQEFVLNDRLFDIGPRTVSVRIDQAHASLAQIGPGQIATVHGQLITNTSAYAPREILVDSLITAQIEALAVQNNQLVMTVLNQPISLRDFTVTYEGAIEIDEDDFEVGNHVKVHGWVQPDGVVIPTRIDKNVNISATNEVSGRIASVDAVNLALNIGELLIDYSSATFIFLSAEELATGALIEAQGTIDPFNNIFVATQIRPLIIGLRATNDPTIDIQGIITSVQSTGQFMLNEQSVVTNELTIFDRGQASDLLGGRLVEVEGTLRYDQSLVATLVRFSEEVLESEIRVYGTVQSIDGVNNSVTVFGIDVKDSIATRFEDHTDSGLPATQLNELNVGDIIEVRSFDEPDGSSSVLATRIRRVTDTNSFVQARVETNQSSVITFLGLEILSNNVTEYEDINGNSISASQFFAQAIPGTLIKVFGNPASGAITATKMAIEENTQSN